MGQNDFQLQCKVCFWDKFIPTTESFIMGVPTHSWLDFINKDIDRRTKETSAQIKSYDCVSESSYFSKSFFVPNFNWDPIIISRSIRKSFRLLVASKFCLAIRLRVLKYSASVLVTVLSPKQWRSHLVPIVQTEKKFLKSLGPATHRLIYKDL